MRNGVRKEDALKLVGKHIYAVRKDGSVASGKLVKISGNKLILSQTKGNKVRTKAIIPLVLFDLLAIGTSPYAYGSYYGGYPGYYGGYGFGGGFGGYGYPFF